LLKNIYKIFILIVFAAFIGCTSNKTPAVRSVYYWKTVFKLSESDVNWMKENGIKKIYLRMFDVDWDAVSSSVLPAGDAIIETRYVKGVEIIPVVFITNRTLVNIPDSLISDLAYKIKTKVMLKGEKLPDNKFNELQIDCDWSEKTKDKYFSLLNLLRGFIKPNIVSATIRLHQVKYFKKTGVPPADKGMLMFYNMEDVRDINAGNSIFNEEIAKNYLYNFNKYPLRLDVVLPAFSWAAVYENGRLVNLVNNISADQLKFNYDYKEVKEKQYICKTDNIINGVLFKANSIVKIEDVSPETTERAASIISGYIRKENLTVSIFHFTQKMVQSYDKKKLENIFSHFN